MSPSHLTTVSFGSKHKDANNKVAKMLTPRLQNMDSRNQRVMSTFCRQSMVGSHVKLLTAFQRVTSYEQRIELGRKKKKKKLKLAELPP